MKKISILYLQYYLVLLSQLVICNMNARGENISIMNQNIGELTLADTLHQTITLVILMTMMMEIVIYVIINEIVQARMNVGRRTEGNKKKKSKTKYRKEEILNLIYQTFKYNLKVIDEASKVFEEYQKKLRKAEFERLVEEGIIDHDGNLRNDSEMEM